MLKKCTFLLIIFSFFSANQTISARSTRPEEPLGNGPPKTLAENHNKPGAVSTPACIDEDLGSTSESSSSDLSDESAGMEDNNEAENGQMKTPRQHDGQAMRKNFRLRWESYGEGETTHNYRWLILMEPIQALHISVILGAKVGNGLSNLKIFRAEFSEPMIPWPPYWATTPFADFSGPKSINSCQPFNWTLNLMGKNNSVVP